MSRRTAEADKAIREAWERERQNVLDGKGTRDWTPEQQRSILDKGKAYDDSGRAFEGQHMKSVAEYPEFQGNSANIQFLTKDEHLEAHKGSWQNPTNWYYNPETKEYCDFGNGDIIPPKIINLLNPVAKTVVKETKEEPYQETSQHGGDGLDKSALLSNMEADQQSLKRQGVRLSSAACMPMTPVPKQSHHGGGRIRKGLAKIRKFIINHPIETIEIAVKVGLVGGRIAGSFINTKGKYANTISSISSIKTSEKALKLPETTTKIGGVAEKIHRASPRNHDVAGHYQRYHIKGDIVWKNKDPYHRGPKKR